MGIKNVDIKNSYTGKGEKILKDFLLPILSESTRYDRITGYYTIESLLAISQGIEKLFESGGSMRIIIGIHSIPIEIVEASLERQYIQDQIEIVRKEISRSITLLSDVMEKRRVATIAWMIEDGLLEVKAAAVVGEGIFHPKTLIFRDAEGNRVVAVGSSNETANGLGGNFEQIMVAKSWENLEAVEDQENFFESLWSNKNEDAIVSDITEDIAEIILSGLGDEFHNPHRSNCVESNNILSDAAKMPANFFVSGDIPALFMHQERAVIDALSRWPVRVLFSDEVGLGKTFEAAATLVFLVKYCNVKRVMILTPKSVIKQWQEELYTHFNMDVWIYDSGSKEYISAKGSRYAMHDKNPVGLSAPDMILMSAQYARGRNNTESIFEKEDTVLPDVMIVDEAHAARISRDISGGKKKTRLYKVLEKISGKIPHIILATATPMQKDVEEYHAILKLLGLPKIWNKERLYSTSLKLISKSDVPDISDASTGASLLYATIKEMKPKFNYLNEVEKDFLKEFIEFYDSHDKYDTGLYVIDNWNIFRKIFIKLHPARLLTVRNTRRALTDVGYVFPKRNLIEANILDSEQIQLFYSKVNEYLTNECFSIEKVLYPEKNINVGFVRISYQQRVASSLYSCIESLKRRYDFAHNIDIYLKAKNHIRDCDLSEFKGVYEFDDFDYDDSTYEDIDMKLNDCEHEINYKELSRAVSLECTSLTSLIRNAEMLLEIYGDMKIKKSIELALKNIYAGDAVLVFSRYTDTIDSLLNEFKNKNEDNHITYGVYTGKTSVIVTNGKEEECSKNRIKQELFNGELKIVFCSDAASEGLNLQAARVLINVDVPWTPARLEQRIGRIARLGQQAEEVDIYNVWYPHSIEARMYHRIQSRLKETNLAIGEFPEVVASNIKMCILNGITDDDTSMKELMDIRNSYQTKALEELWYKKEDKYTTSDIVRQKLIGICDKYYDRVKNINRSKMIDYILPDGSVMTVTELSGMSESISLKSDILKDIDLKIPKVATILDEKGIPKAFSYNDYILKHEDVFELFDTSFNRNMILDRWPKMLPDQTNLSLLYKTKDFSDEAPILWKDEDINNGS